MNGFLSRLGASFRSTFAGRYGIDRLTIAIIIAALVLSLIVTFTGFDLLSVLSFAGLIYAVFRCYSSNIAARTKELEWFDRVTAAPKKQLSLAGKRWRNRKTTAYFTCKTCGTVYSVPKGKGRLRVTCPHCHEQTIHTT